ncbi:MAG: hypothetical protein UV61_C0004G0058 [Candidatus Gottesmanbacteria bacterium GW2011_GWB1_43_11]|uniref:Uncharacterized protein n=1 Tax=Candidatus Gottesmanbacteria bacterium GW2011_GWB1_43_11 TaxID=1618446 RepID=A0A0G1CNT2_9BACT|nr:MAG: hypothetical protein UV55_C0004G0050 [Candidatus Gottesmanbacteria bacterium GW2011_GWC1_43_10]KKS87132.1 MAG: hypothetical protein UV61_C0004G0058 [Candidatus Gottesmanbacteria bacterium GW2011_GWB1_43_11]
MTNSPSPLSYEERESIIQNLDFHFVTQALLKFWAASFVQRTTGLWPAMVESCHITFTLPQVLQQIKLT